MKFKNFFKWEYFERLLRTIEVSAIIVASCIVFQIPKQIDEWKSSQGDRSINMLIKLEDKFNDGSNPLIFNAIDNNKPILIKNGGTLDENDLDGYLNDLSSVGTVYEKKLITEDELSEWFSDYFLKTENNLEVNDYLKEIRKNNEGYYLGIDNAIQAIKRYNSNN